MKRFRRLLAACVMLTFMISSTALAAPRDRDDHHKQTRKPVQVQRPQERHHGESPPATTRQPQQQHRKAPASWRSVLTREHRPEHQANWHRQHRDWHWFSGLQHDNVRVYRHADRYSRVHFEHSDFRVFYEAMRGHYGHYSHRDRYSYRGMNGWAYYWLGPASIIRAFVTDSGHVYTTVWDRSELEYCVQELGYGEPSSFSDFVQYIRIIAALMDDDD